MAEDQGAPEYLVIARLLSPHGVHGELRAQILTDFPERFATLDTVYVGQPPEAYRLASARPRGKQIVIKLAGIDSVEQAEAFRAADVSVPLAQAVTLRKGQYYWHQIIGLDVHTVDGRHLGRISHILTTGANDVYIVQLQEDGELLLPAIEDVIKDVDLSSKRLVVALLPGMLS